MNLLSYLLALSILVLLMIEAVAFHKATVCRQEAWLKGTELITKTLLSKGSPSENSFLPGCKIHLIQRDKSVYWQNLMNLKKHPLVLNLKGNL